MAIPSRTPRWLLTLVVLLLATHQGLAVDPSKVTVMAYNVGNMFDVFDNPYTDDEGTAVKPRWETERIAAVVRKINPDILAVIEVENEGILKALVHEMLPEAGYEYVAAMPTNSVRGGNLGLISRLPIVSLTSHRFDDLNVGGRAEKWRFARDLVLARFQVGDDSSDFLDVFIAHFKSKRDSHNDEQSRYWRLAEARGARRIIDRHRRLHPLDRVLLVGDLNDTPDAPPLQTLFETMTDSPPPLVDVHAHMPARNRITYIRGQFHSTVDYILASPTMGKRLVRDSAYVEKDEDLLSGSDHAPVVAAFDMIN